MIKIENISYGYKPKQPIFSDISLKVGSGIYGLLGENGVGKTTLIHLICGLLFPWKGECSIDNSNSARRSPELLNRYFFLPEEMQMPTESIYQFAARHSVFYPRFSRKDCEQNLEELHIDGKQKLSAVSYGQQKKAMLAYALALHTPLTLLDEPTNDIDVNTLRALEEGLENFAGCAVVISHDRWFLDRICTHILAFEGDSKVFYFEGSYSEYEENKKKRMGDVEPHRVRYRKLME